MENMDSKTIWDDLKQYHKKNAIRFLQARNVKIDFLFAKQKKLQISSNSMKLKEDGYSDVIGENYGDTLRRNDMCFDGERLWALVGLDVIYSQMGDVS